MLLLLAGAFAPVSIFAADQQAAEAVKRATPVDVGEMAPDFTLEDQNGRPLTLSAERGKRPVVLVFYRGYW